MYTYDYNVTFNCGTGNVWFYGVLNRGSGPSSGFSGRERIVFTGGGVYVGDTIEIDGIDSTHWMVMVKTMDGGSGVAFA